MVGRRSSRRFTATAFASGVAALVVLAAAAGSGGRSASSCGATVKVTDHEKYVVNQYLQDAMRYVPGSTTIRSGCSLTFEFATPDQNDPHSLSVVKRADLPRTDAQMEACPVCKEIKSQHVGDPTLPAGPKNPILHWTVNVGDVYRPQAGARRARRQSRHLRVGEEGRATGAPEGDRAGLGARRDDALLHVRDASVDAGQNRRHVTG
jgi:hypothetical protein